MRVPFFFLAAMMTLGTLAAPFPATIDWKPTHTDQWKGFPRHHFKVDGCNAWVVTPKKPAPGNQWVWCMEFPTAFDNRTGVVPLVNDGFYYVHISVGNTFGAPSAQKHLDAFYDHIVAKGLNPKGSLIGVSRGGLYIYGFARRHPERVVTLYGDAPVCDFKSWPAGKLISQDRIYSGSKGDWDSLMKLYGFKDLAAASAYADLPLDLSTLKVLKQAGIPLIHVVGDVDVIVPPVENTLILQKRYRELGGTITVFHKPDCNHHPHGLEDPAPVVKLIKKYTAERAAK